MPMQRKPDSYFKHLSATIKKRFNRNHEYTYIFTLSLERRLRVDDGLDGPVEVGLAVVAPRGVRARDNLYLSTIKFKVFRAE